MYGGTANLEVGQRSLDAVWLQHPAAWAQKPPFGLLALGYCHAAWPP